ncbi:DnaJ-domain-containing protein [Amylocystis lapponica]|nr:DnaJ-domain-containing protein [Amylocystis lapponica]
MDDREDPISTFFSDPDSVDLYEVLSLTSTATSDEIRKAYRRLALVHHPDKHATASKSAKADASHKFQQIGFAYAVLGDEKRRQRYDRTGKTDEGFDLAPGEDGWETYFEELFESVTKEKLDELKREYQGSSEEVDDLKKTYVDVDGSIGEIMKHIPHSTHADEARFIVLISDLIRMGDLPSLPGWESSVKDEKARLIRQKQSDKEAREAEDLAKELGVWDEFYGNGKPGARKGKGKGKGKQKEDDGVADEEDHSVLQALMLKRKKNMDGFFDSLAAKYAEPEAKGTGKKNKKRGKGPEEEDEAMEESPKKKSRKNAQEPPDIDDEEFMKLQQTLFGNKAKGQDNSAPDAPTKGKAKRTRATTGRKAR